MSRKRIGLVLPHSFTVCPLPSAAVWRSARVCMRACAWRERKDEKEGGGREIGRERERIPPACLSRLPLLLSICTASRCHRSLLPARPIGTQLSSAAPPTAGDKRNELGEESRWGNQREAREDRQEDLGCGGARDVHWSGKCASTRGKMTSEMERMEEKM